MSKFLVIALIALTTVACKKSSPAPKSDSLEITVSDVDVATNRYIIVATDYDKGDTVFSVKNKSENTTYHITPVHPKQRLMVYFRVQKGDDLGFATLKFYYHDTYKGMLYGDGGYGTLVIP